MSIKLVDCYKRFLASEQGNLASYLNFQYFTPLVGIKTYLDLFDL